MNEYFLHNQYFEWLCELVDNKKYAKGYSYKKLFAYLHNVNFNYLIAMDGNRDEDGIDLRYRFGSENGIHQAEIASILDVRPCSVLEMMCALAIRCEETIMNDPDHDYGTDKWFWVMLENLGLESMNDICFDKREAMIIIDRFLNRDYEYDGKGGLFQLRHPPKDLRTVEIWYQMCWYLDEYLNI